MVNAKYDDLPANVHKEGGRTLVYWVGVAIGGLRHETVEVAERKFLTSRTASFPRRGRRKRWICAGRSKRSTTRTICRVARQFEV